MKNIMLGAALALVSSHAEAQSATLTLPSVTFTSPVSSSIGCTETAAANSVVPVAANTVIFTCSVSPSTWGGLSLEV